MPLIIAGIQCHKSPEEGRYRRTWRVCVRSLYLAISPWWLIYGLIRMTNCDDGGFGFVFLFFPKSRRLTVQMIHQRIRFLLLALWRMARGQCFCQMVNLLAYPLSCIMTSVFLHKAHEHDTDREPVWLRRKSICRSGHWLIPAYKPVVMFNQNSHYPWVWLLSTTSQPFLSKNPISGVMVAYPVPPGCTVVFINSIQLQLIKIH